MTRPTVTLLLLVLLASCGCGSQSILFEGEGEYLFTAFDALALPGERVELRARLQMGDLLKSRGGCVVRFLRDGQLYKAAETDDDGVAVVTFVPDKPGAYRFTAELSPNGFPDNPPPGRELLVACRKSDEPAMIVDLDKTLVASGFHLVLIGEPEPMPDSPKVMQRLAEKHSVIYLTHRPDYFGPKSKAWLAKYNYPAGPVLLSDIGGFFSGSAAFKTKAIRQLCSRFKNIQIGIGDKVSDVKSYHENGIRSFLILGVPQAATADQLRILAKSLETLPDQVQVVTSWSQIENVLFGNKSFPRSEMQRKLEKKAEEKTPQNK